jgi:hypothetical protein
MPPQKQRRHTQQLQQHWSKRPQQTASPAAAKTRTAAQRLLVKVLTRSLQLQCLTQLRMLLRSSSSYSRQLVMHPWMLLLQTMLKAQQTVKQLHSRWWLMQQQKH